MTDRELMQMVLDALEKISMGGDPRWADDVMPALRARLAQPEPEEDGGCQACEGNHCTAKNGCIALDNPKAQPEHGDGYRWREGDVPPSMTYTAPPQREWQDLTDDESDEIWGECLGVFDCLKMTQAKLKEKNT